MATYQELFNLTGAGNGSQLQQQILVAIAVKANLVAHNGTATAGAKAWAIQALQNPAAYLPTCLNYILAEYNASTLAVILAATDAQVQSAVNAAVDTLLGV